LVRVAATTAVVAGTAGAVHHRQQQKYAGQQAEAQQQAEFDQMQQQLAQLHTAGVLSDEEFAAAKAKLLGG
jgi:hypothetical protein